MDASYWGKGSLWYFSGYGLDCSIMVPYMVTGCHMGGNRMWFLIILPHSWCVFLTEKKLLRSFNHKKGIAMGMAQNMLDGCEITGPGNVMWHCSFPFRLSHHISKHWSTLRLTGIVQSHPKSTSLLNLIFGIYLILYIYIHLYHSTFPHFSEAQRHNWWGVSPSSQHASVLPSIRPDKETSKTWYFTSRLQRSTYGPRKPTKGRALQHSALLLSKHGWSGGPWKWNMFSVQHPGGLYFHLLSILFHIFPCFQYFVPYFSIFLCSKYWNMETSSKKRKNNYGTWTIIENHRTYSFFQLFQRIGTWNIIDLQFRSRVSAKKHKNPTTQTKEGLPLKLWWSSLPPRFFFITMIGLVCWGFF